MGRHLIIDNYDSFVFNISRYCVELGEETIVLRNQEVGLDEVQRLAPASIILSPGPGTPREAGISLRVVETLSGRIPILGVCLGHQCIGAAFGGNVTRANTPMHGRASNIWHNGLRLFRGLPLPLQVGRYHSLAVRPTEAMNDALVVDATSEDGEVMALSHLRHPTFGVQFHPESILTTAGHRLFRNFFDIAKGWSHGAVA